MTSKEKKKICDICGGTGQISYFKGVSRFLLSNEECGGCAGTGYELDTADKNTESITAQKTKRKPIQDE